MNIKELVEEKIIQEYRSGDLEELEKEIKKKDKPKYKIGQEVLYYFWQRNTVGKIVGIDYMPNTKRWAYYFDNLISNAPLPEDYIIQKIN